jgi:hypothetical protein
VLHGFKRDSKKGWARRVARGFASVTDSGFAEGEVMGRARRRGYGETSPP